MPSPVMIYLNCIRRVGQSRCLGVTPSAGDDGKRMHSRWRELFLEIRKDCGGIRLKQHMNNRGGIALRAGDSAVNDHTEASRPSVFVYGATGGGLVGWPTGASRRPSRETVRSWRSPTILGFLRIPCRQNGQFSESLIVGGHDHVIRVRTIRRVRRCDDFENLTGFLSHPPPLVGSSIIGGHRNALAGC